MPVADKRGYIQCNGTGCPQLDEIPSVRAVEGEGDTPPSDILGNVYLVSRSKPAWWIVLLSLAPLPLDIRRGGVRKQIFLRLEECMSCCLRTAMQYESFEVVFTT
jgi:hypothetical protein